ncbi:hypothetical protein ABZ153_10555 [Streptomyces sp. NPDC006290]|uniref:hypothetical protein n=1 Tax=Streptomyces sp. NPDC006290 TaxID=3156745 RepID=UPI0033BB8C87
MKVSPGTRMHVLLTMVMVVCVVAGGACFGFVFGGWAGAAVGAGTSAVGVGLGGFFHSQIAVDPPPGVRTGGALEGIADVVVMGVALYEAAVFPVVPGGVSDREQKARRTVAYRLAAYEGLPRAVRISAAGALEVIDEGLDKQRARTAVKELSLTVYDSRSGH